MNRDQETRLGRFSPKCVADAADRKFVEFGRFLMRIATGQHAQVGRHADETLAGDSPAGTGPNYFVALAEQIDRIVRRSSEAGKRVASATIGNSSRAPTPDTVQRGMKQLFHEDKQRRLAAVRWIREQGCSEAVPTLEGVLSIEESSEVRAEILRALHDLEDENQVRKGEAACSRS